MSDDHNSDFADVGATKTVQPRTDPDRPKLRLLVMTQAGVLVRPLPVAGRLVIGRAQQTDVPIEDHSVSRRHAILHITPHLAIEDLGSRNGTRASGIRLTASEVLPVRPGDLIEIGSVTLTIQRTAAPNAVPSLTESAEIDLGAGPPTMQHRPGFVAGSWLTRSWPMLSRIAAGNISVLLRGDTGVGKEIIAELIHFHSRRSDGPLVRLNCAALPENMIESEIFGHERGAFTGAHATKRGLLETAHGGTLFLDEIGELPVALQAKLLRAIEDGSFRRVGSNTDKKVDVRFVSATNVDLETAISEGTFRSDLLYRLNAFTIAIPPLRQRPDEVETIAQTLVVQASSELDQSAPDISSTALVALQAHSWPGNIRELKNVIERAVLLCDTGPIELHHLPPELSQPSSPTTAVVTHITGGVAPADDVSPELAADPERRRIISALNQCGGNQTRAAEILGISRRTLSSRLTKYRIPRPRGGA